MKRIFGILLVLLLFVTMPVLAEEQKDYVIDEADLISDSQEEKLQERLEGICQKHDVDLVIVTVDSLDGYSPKEFADGVYDGLGYADDGALLLVCMDSRDWYVSTIGKGERIMDSAVKDRVVGSLSSGNYYTAFSDFADLCEESLAGNPVIVIVICIGLGLLVAFIVTGVMKSKLKSVRAKPTATDYVVPGSLDVKIARDLFLYRTVSRKAKPKNNSGSGSSGRSHGGGGGKF